jgi:hypothetical protein
MKILCQRILTPVFLVAALAAGAPAHATPGDAFDQALDVSLKEKKGVVLYVKGQAISGRVTKVDNENVELTSREFARIVVRRDRIDAVAGN